MKQEQLVLANQLSNHLECCRDFESQLSHVIRNYKDCRELDWNRVFRQAIEDDVLGCAAVRELLMELHADTVAYTKVVQEELAAI